MDPIVKGKRFLVRAEVDFHEYVGRKKSGEISRMWETKPVTMIRKCALVAAQREAFPDLFGGLYTQEEIPEASEVEPAASEGEILDIDQGTDEVFQDKDQEEGAREEPKKRLRRNVIQFNGEKIKTCGIDGVHLASAGISRSALYNLLKKHKVQRHHHELLEKYGAVNVELQKPRVYVAKR